MLINRTQRFTAVMLFLVFLLGLVGCSQAGNANDGSNQPTNDTAEPSSAEPVELVLSAAASLTDALTELQTLYQSEHENVTLQFNFGGSGALQKQIENGAPADLFLSAASGPMETLVADKFVEEDEQTKLLNNELVVVTPAGGQKQLTSLNDLTNSSFSHIAIGIPESVPAGNYAKEALLSASLWEPLTSKTVQAKDVRQVLQYVETGNADAGFVYRTDALTSEKAQVALTVDQSLYTPVEYRIGILKATEHKAAAEELYAYLQSSEAHNVFEKYGFTVPE
ncbi:molybdate ABC transporter substrate-binding protein [Paenibacillus sp. HB172176]|uniref:molybdate ABC transporter substrate-binding protein n=1 Tax=Paenibacillus sp. HB172176 TaxID=2493690 RepID=UPI001F0DD13E|nr:molybdate ABC transporter substrate-binding protein [Paenibacillus sp. HB172176]